MTKFNTLSNDIHNMYGLLTNGKLSKNSRRKNEELAKYDQVNTQALILHNMVL